MSENKEKGKIKLLLENYYQIKLTIEDVPWGNYRWDITAGKLSQKFTVEEKKERNKKKCSKKYRFRISHNYQ
jgi:hypothetical protein